MGFWVATAKSNTSNMKINPPPPVSWSGEAVCQPVIGVEPLINTWALQRAVARPRWEISQGHARKTEICVCPQSSCVCVCWGSEGLWSQLLKVGRKVSEGGLWCVCEGDELQSVRMSHSIVRKAFNLLYLSIIRHRTYCGFHVSQVKGPILC